MKNFWHYMESVQKNRETEVQSESKMLASFDNPNSAKILARKIIRIANSESESELYEKQFELKFKNIPEPSKVLTPQDIAWAKNILVLTLETINKKKKDPQDELYDWFEDLPEGLY